MAEYVPKTDEEVKTLAMDIYTGKVFTSDMAGEQVGSVFMLLGLMDQEMRDEIAASIFDPDTKSGGFLYEDFSERAPKSVNGMPIFFSLKVCHWRDAPRVQAKLDAIRKAMAAI